MVDSFSIPFCAAVFLGLSHFAAIRWLGELMPSSLAGNAYKEVKMDWRTFVQVVCVCNLSSRTRTGHPKG
jgi:hypothetical protein